MKTVRAKFKVTEKNQSPDNTELGSVKLEAVYDSNPESENGTFFKWTPYGRLEMGTVNKEAFEQFEVGKEYYIDFTKSN